jgi:asparagine synthase (glutamine-hydrolysing)
MELLSEKEILKTGIFSFPVVQKLLGKISTGELVTEMDNMALAGLISTQLIYHQYILKDGFRPALKELTNTRIIYEQNPAYTH